MTPRTIRVVQESWAQVALIAPKAGALFYSNLFEADPSLRSLFKGDMGSQGEKLMQMINGAVGSLTSLEALVPVLQGLGRRHVAYGVQAEHYDTVGVAFIKTLRQGLGQGFTPEVEAAWTEVYEVMAKVMQQGSALDTRQDTESSPG